MTPAQISAAVALEALLQHYVCLVNCGDCGNWNPEEEPVVIAARAALAAPRTPASTGEGEVERLKADLKDEINFDLNTRVNKVPESVVDQVVDLLAERGVLTIAALPPSSGWEAGAEAMRKEAAWVAEHAHLVEPDGGSPTEDEAAVASEAARRIRALPLPPPPSSEGA